MLLWAGPECYGALSDAAAQARRPGMVFLSSSLLKESFLAVPEAARQFTYFTYPYRLDLEITRGKDLGKMGMMPPQNAPLPVASRNVAQKTAAIAELMPEIYMMMLSNFYRDYMLDIIGMCGDMKDAPYDWLSFGPGQRYAAKGCYIVQLTEGAEPGVMKKSGWVIH